ncbi:hypothetical protein [Kordiimonas lacus]|uniref:HAD family hydrolase n=1 Tax=Kordiimonas lacus TaxID=637679 RepID=A0A1G7C3Q5_9PROT|nr:hypothetical protein [Kordiimonas lacus]SDE33893.1 hypothetical protein SAMN04488071_2642 [Kordiimonas lacus]
MTSVSDLITSIDPHRPLLLLDADEVLLRFVETLEQYLVSQGVELRLTSFQLGGNIFPLGGDAPVPGEQVRDHIAGFFDTCVDEVPLVDGALEALDGLREHYQIAILSNVPSRCRARREASLKAQGLDFPVIANKGDKGPGAKQLADAIRAHTVFVDDLPPQHASVAAHAPDIHRVHFIGDPRLAALIGKAPDAHVRFDDWPTLESHLKDLMQGHPS